MRPNWNGITKENVIEAIRIFEENSVEYPAARNTFLEVNGNLYPAKHIRAISYQVAHGSPISKSDFHGGKETARFFEKLGFKVKYIPTAQRKCMKAQTVNDKEQRTIRKATQGMNELRRKNSITHSVKITHEGVIEQKNALQLVLNKQFDGDIVSEKTFSWLVTPPNDDKYNKLISSLQEYRNKTGFYKAGQKLRCDFVCESQKIIIEYDERQHFTLARKIALETYPPNIPLYFNKDKWIAACEAIQAKDNNPPNRDEKRAYYDSIRDILAAQNGYKLIRIMHGDYNWENENSIEHLDALLKIKSGRTCTPMDNEVNAQPTGLKKNNSETSIVTATIQANSSQYKINKAHFETLEKVVSKYARNDIILFPAGFFYHSRFSERQINKTIKKVSTILKAKASETVVCVGIDFDNSNDQLALAINQSGALAIGRKFYPTEEEKFTINYSSSFCGEEIGYKRIFKVREKVFYLAVCYDVFGIRHQKLANPGIDAVLSLVHRFHPRGEGPSGEVDFARKGFAGASAEWDCPVFGAAVFFDREVPARWPTAVLWQSGNKSVKSFKYTDNQMMSSNNYMLNSDDEDVLCKTYYLL